MLVLRLAPLLRNEVSRGSSYPSVLCVARRFRRGPETRSVETISERVLALREKGASEKHGVSRFTSASSFYTPCDIDDDVDGGKSIGGTVSRSWDTSAPDRWRIRTWPTPPTQIDKTRYIFRRFDGADALAPSPPLSGRMRAPQTTTSTVKKIF